MLLIDIIGKFVEQLVTAIIAESTTEELDASQK